MATDYILFIHGVYMRSSGIQPSYANSLIELLKQNLQTSSRTIKPLIVYWGDLNDPPEKELRKDYKKSSIWHKLWFKHLREVQLTRFTGDIALYLSRHVGAGVVERVAQEIEKIQNPSPDDRLHLVTHSLGTVILFDLLFSARWDEKEAPGRNSVMTIRDTVYGATGKSDNPEQGIRLGSVTTMGSPIGIFSLIATASIATALRVTPTHDITGNLEKLLDYMHQELGGKKLSWLNFVHPGDPIAYTLEGLLPSLVDWESKYIDIHDILVPANLREILTEEWSEAIRDLLTVPFRQCILALLHTATAHGSYWQSKKVAKLIAQMIQTGNLDFLAYSDPENH
jgi:hypothetical protein